MIHLFLILFVTFHDVYSMENGADVQPGEYSFVVTIRKVELYICSGIIINDRNILTVGHTIAKVPTALLRVITGTIENTFISLGTSYPVRTVYFHPEFRQRSIPGMEHEEFFENDIAVLRENMQSKKLQWDFIKYVTDEVSQLWNTHLLEHQVAFNDIFEQDAISSEDLGSPIICDSHVIGIVVKGGNRVHPEKPSTLLLIYHYLEFIWEIITDGLFDIHPWKFPYVTSIWNLNTHLCGGFIVDANHIATTGSCVKTIHKNNLRAVVGYTDVPIFNSTIDWLLIKDVMLHPDYDVPSKYYTSSELPPYDFAILTLVEPLAWSPNISPLVMGESDNFAGSQVCQVLRWKPTSFQNKLQSITLKRSLAIIWDEQQLRTRIARPDESSFWARTPYLMPIVEKTDAGNPIICGDYPIGIVLQDPQPRSWLGPPSARFLKIRPLIEFISNVTRRI